MLWFFVALAAPALSALVNYIDKYILVRYKETGGLGTIILLSCYFGFLILPIATLFDSNIFAINGWQILLMLSNGFLAIYSTILYLRAIEKEDVVFAVPVMQSIPVFGFLFGFLILGEKLTPLQIVGALIVILGALVLSFEIEERKLKLKKKVLALVLGSSAAFALSGVIFKLVAIERGFWITLFWEYSGILLTGVLLFIFMKSYRQSFVSVIKNNRFKALALNAKAEVLMIASELFLLFAVLLAPVVLVFTVNSFHPAFIFIYNALIILLFPKLAKEMPPRGHFTHKLASTAIMVIGAIILLL